MYEIFLFHGGVYRFDELKEAVEDMGGMVLKENLFHISRGTSYLADEVQVMLIIPLDDAKIIKTLSNEIKGHLEKFDTEDLKKKDILTYMAIYDVLIKSGKWMTLDEMKDTIECPCTAQICENQGIEVCIHDQIEKSINKFCRKGMLKNRGKDKLEYNLKEN